MTFVLQLYQQTQTSSEVESGPATPSDDSLLAAVHAVQSLEMNVNFSLYVDLHDPSVAWRGTFDPADPSAWFASYGKFAQHYAALSEANGVEQISVGVELETLASKYRAQWDELIAKTRAVYKGRVTYDANWAAPERVVFWDKVDVISISGYFPLAGSSLEESWREVDRKDIRPLVERYGHPVEFGEVGYRSVAGAREEPFNWWRTGPVDEAEQAADYEALFRFWSQRDDMVGVSIWKWEVSRAAVDPSDYTPQGKPAQAVISTWFTGR